MNFFQAKIGTFLLVVGIHSNLLAANPACSASHCTQVSAQSSELCNGNAEILGLSIEEYKARGGRAVTSENGVSCTCTCSCVVANTSILTSRGYKAIGQLIKDDRVSTPLSEKTSFSSLVKFHKSDGQGEKSQITKLSNGSIITSSLNHTFITPEEMVISAEQLKLGSEVLGANGEKLFVENIQTRRLKKESLYNVSVSLASTSPIDHVINLNGVLSGDWLLQSTNDLVEEEVFLRTSLVKLYK